MLGLGFRGFTYLIMDSYCDSDQAASGCSRTLRSVFLTLSCSCPMQATRNEMHENQQLLQLRTHTHTQSAVRGNEAAARS